MSAGGFVRGVSSILEPLVAANIDPFVARGVEEG